MTPKKIRLDVALVERGLAPSRERAQALIMAGQVRVDGQVISKASAGVAADSPITLEVPDHPYVSRGGVKLAAALREFAIDVNGLTCLDVGASAGGFTDCLLQHGASKVVALDVGHNQIDWKLRNDPRLELREGVNARHLSLSDFEAPFDLVTIDVAFISATKILPAVLPLLNERGRISVGR